MMKKLFVIITLLAAMLLSAATSLAAAPSLVDNAKLLTASQRITVERKLREVEQKHGIRCAVVTVQSVGAVQPGEYANKLIDTVYNDGKNGNVVFLQVTGQRKWYISTDKKLKDVIVGNPGTEFISKAAVPYLKNNDEAGAYKTYAAKVDYLMSYYEEHGKGWAPKKPFPWIAVVGALIAGLAAARGYGSSLTASMSNVREQVAADAYLDRQSFELTNRQDIYTYTSVAAIPKPKNDREDAADGSVSDSCSDGGHGGGGGDY